MLVTVAAESGPDFARSDHLCSDRSSIGPSNLKRRAPRGPRRLGPTLEPAFLEDRRDVGVGDEACKALSRPSLKTTQTRRAVVGIVKDGRTLLPCLGGSRFSAPGWRTCARSGRNPSISAVAKINSGLLPLELPLCSSPSISTARSPGVSALLPQPDGFEGLALIFEQPKASDLPVLDREHERACSPSLRSRRAPAGGVRLRPRTRLREVMRLDLDSLKRREELRSQKVLPGARPDLDRRPERPSGVRPVNLLIERHRAEIVVRSRRFHASNERRTTSTFSSDIAYSRSPAASRAWSVVMYSSPSLDHTLLLHRVIDDAVVPFDPRVRCRAVCRVGETSLTTWFAPASRIFFRASSSIPQYVPDPGRSPLEELIHAPLGPSKRLPQRKRRIRHEELPSIQAENRRVPHPLR